MIARLPSPSSRSSSRSPSRSPSSRSSSRSPSRSPSRSAPSMPSRERTPIACLPSCGRCGAGQPGRWSGRATRRGTQFTGVGWRWIAVLLALGGGSVGLAEPPSQNPPAQSGAADADAAAPRYETEIAPLLAEFCGRCHNADTRKAELDLSSPRSLFQGGESGPAVEPGKLDESLLWEMVDSGSMPPEDEPQLSEAQRLRLRRWIQAGCPLESGQSPAELQAAGEVSNLEIEPLMLLRCGTCHGLRQQQAGLDLRTREAMLRGGKSGPAMVPGKPAESLLLRRIHAGEMPPPEQLVRAGVRPMTDSELELLRRWIELGAPEVERRADVADGQDDPLVSDDDRRFWSFQPPRRPEPPLVEAGEPLDSPIDAFVLRRLREQGLEFSPEADRATLLRRACLDLTGLPPTAEQVEAFLADTDPRAYEKLVDRLLASPRYGERWARFWLDAAGYADSEGKRSADPLRPHAYRYRDYVIRALNADKPYDRFLLEQIAGDELADYESAAEITPELADNLIATGFLRLAPDGTGSDIVNTVAERLEVVADEIDIFGSTVLGLTLKCARCHSHKYDPLPQRDYYRLVAIFKGAYDEHDWLKPSFVRGQTKDARPGRVLPYVTEPERREYEAAVRQLDARVAEQQARLTRLADRLRSEHVERQLAELPADLQPALRRMLAEPPDQRDAASRELAGQYEARLRLSDEALKKLPAYQELDKEVTAAVKKLEQARPEEPAIRALWDRGEPSPTYMYRRGDFQQPGRLVGPGVPSVLTDGSTPFEVQPPWPGAKQTGRRLALARWLVRPDHPLTARVMVNRVWRHHFDRGLVKSVDNFGQLGDRPTHPELLDWLAVEFVRQGWSLKRLHRLIMTSRTYRQSSRLTERLDRLDPENQWLARMPLRRMDAEQLRDSLLHVAGQLHERPFGQPDPVQVHKSGLVVAEPVAGGWRRSIYLRQRRKEMPTFLETFDLPQMIPACQQRVDSTVAQQALYLLNNSLVRELSERFADRAAERSLDIDKQLEWIYQTAFGRPPDDEERELGRASLEALRDQWRQHLQSGGAPGSEAGDRADRSTGTGAEGKPGAEGGPGSEGEAERKALAVFCHALMNSAGFVYVD